MRAATFAPIAALLLLATACGAPTPPEAAPAAATTASQSGTAPAASAAPTAVPNPLPTAVAPTSAPAPPAAPAAQTAAGDTYRGIAQSRTPDGFYVLGAPNAPVTLTDYSDFL